jgi:DNA processing protein
VDVFINLSPGGFHRETLTSSPQGEPLYPNSCELRYHVLDFARCCPNYIVFRFLFAYTVSMQGKALSPPDAISPWLEMGAYEFLWTKLHQSFKKLADLFHGADAVPSDFVLPAIAEKLAKEASDILRSADVHRFGIRVSGTADYPARLRDAKNPVQMLYFQGWWDLVESMSVALVGTRKPTERGLKDAAGLARQLVEDKYTVVSGLADGIDTVAHRTAIECGGTTIAVIGTPLSRSYPEDNSELQKQIAREYLLISQVPVVRYAQQDWRYNRSFFPQRNITMSALTNATVIVEASDTSGTLMQARAALQQKRKLFILDGCFADPKLKWPRLFEGLGAIRVKDYKDIREHLADPAPKDR